MNDDEFNKIELEQLPEQVKSMNKTILDFESELINVECEFIIGYISLFILIVWFSLYH